MSSALIISAIYVLSVPSLTLASTLDVPAGNKVQGNTNLASSVISNHSAGAQIKLQKYGGDPHGADPHGDDPHDEQHDDGMQANKDQKSYKAPKDVYGNQYPNTQAPY